MNEQTKEMSQWIQDITARATVGCGAADRQTEADGRHDGPAGCVQAPPFFVSEQRVCSLVWHTRDKGAVVSRQGRGE